MRRTAALVLLGLALGMIVAGCKGKDQSAGPVAESYVALMTAEKYGEAAKLWDYVTEARTQNEGWDNIQKGQRTLIINKLAEEKATSLKLWSGYFPSGTKVSDVQESGDTATAKLEGGRVSTLELISVDGKWKISGME